VRPEFGVAGSEQALQVSVVSDVERAFARRPLYAVLFHATPADGPYLPTVAVQYRADSDMAVPHGFDREVACALPGLWYCLHLPNTLWELADISALGIKRSQALDLAHRIVLAPVDIFDREHVGEWLDHDVPVVALCPDDLIDEAARRSEALGFALPPVPYSELSTENLREHWRTIHALLVPDAAYLGREPTLTHRLDLAPTDLPCRWLTRQFRDVAQSPLDADDERDGLVARALWRQLILAATARLEHEQATPEDAANRMPDVIEKERTRLRIPVVVALPGKRLRTFGARMRRPCGIGSLPSPR
jgi:hypothetical protein